MIKKIIHSIVMIIIPLLGISQFKYPPSVQAVINVTTNKTELEKALQFFYATKDSIKIKSINFLIANMSAHYSKNYYWADSGGKKIPYNELEYTDFSQSVKAFEAIKQKYKGVHPISYSYKDIDSIKADVLIENVELAIKAVQERYKNKTAIFDEEFYEYILPYRTSIEPLQSWRKVYTEKFSNLIKRGEPSDTQILRIAQNIKSWFTNTYKIESRGEPLPRLGGLQLLHRAKGACEDIAGLATLMARSQGYSCTVDFVPAWATASGIHYLNYINLSTTLKHHYDAADGNILDTLAREPAKVIRTTYSIQPETAAYILKDDSSMLPDNFFRLKNYKDVTHEYWQTANVSIPLFKKNDTLPLLAYICVWNWAKWKPVWFAKINKNNQPVFTNMCKGAVYLPAYYKNGKIIPAGWPIINGYNFTQLLQPDQSTKRTLYIKEDPKYIVFKGGKKYKLYYWENEWVLLSEQIPTEQTTALVFENVPSNALLLIRPEYTQGKERPFIVTATGQRLWF